MLGMMLGFPDGFVSSVRERIHDLFARFEGAMKGPAAFSDSAAVDGTSRNLCETELPAGRRTAVASARVGITRRPSVRRI